MQAGAEFRRQRLVHGPRTRHAGLARQRRGHHPHTVMCLPAGDAVALGMSRMLGTVIDNFNATGAKAASSASRIRSYLFVIFTCILAPIECCQFKSSAHIRTMNTTTRKPRAFAPDPDAPGQPCDVPGCAQPGEYRAPKSRAGLREFHWFCLEHVRAYNASWDYYKGMSAGEIEAQLRADTSWQRPTWPLGQLGHTARMDEALENELHAFAFGPRPKPAPNPAMPAELREALGVLGLLWPVTLDAVKASTRSSPSAIIRMPITATSARRRR